MPAPFKQAVISPDALARVGRALYGDQWQTALARDLRRSLRGVAYMAAGKRGISVGVVRDLLALIVERELALALIDETLTARVAAHTSGKRHKSLYGRA